MTVLEKIQAAVRSLNEPTELYKEARLDDGRTVATEAEEFAPGADVKVIGDDGSTSELAAGTYKLEAGGGFTIGDDGRIAMEKDEDKDEMKGDKDKDEMGGHEDEEKKDMDSHYGDDDEKKMADHEDEEKEMAEHDDEKDKEEMAYNEVLAAFVSRFEVDEDKAKEMAAFVADVYKPQAMAEHEDDAKKKEEMSATFSAFADEVNNGFEAILARLEKIENEPGANPAAVTPEGFDAMVGRMHGHKSRDKETFSKVNSKSIQDRVRNSIFQNV